VPVFTIRNLEMVEYSRKMNSGFNSRVFRRCSPVVRCPRTC